MMQYTLIFFFVFLSSFEAEKLLTKPISSSNTSIESSIQKSSKKKPEPSPDEIKVSQNKEKVIAVDLEKKAPQKVVKKESAPETQLKKEPYPMYLKGLIREVLKRNTSMSMDRLELKITSLQEDYEKEIFEPLFTIGWKKTDQNSPTAAADTLSIGGSPSFNRDGESLNASFGGLLPSGANWAVEFFHNQTKGTVVDNFRDYHAEFDSQTKVTLRQPLWKGLGTKSTLADYHRAVLDGKIFKGSFEKRLMMLVEKTVKEYWKYYGGQKLLDSLRKSVALSEESVELLRKRFEKGDGSELELLEAKSGLASRRLEFNSMKSKVEESKNILLELLNIPTSISHKVSFATQEKDIPFEERDLETCFKIAVKQLPDMIVAENQLEKSKIEFEQKKDDLNPQLDLTGSAWLSQLNSSDLYGDLFDKDYRSWEFGVEFSIPLNGGQREKKALAMARLRREQSQQGLSSLKRQIKIALQSKIAQYQASKAQEKDIKESYEIKEKIFDIERQKLKLGESEIRNVLAKEEDMIEDHRRLINKLIEVKYAEVAINQWMGRLLKHYLQGIDLYKIDTVAWDGEIHIETFLE